MFLPCFSKSPPPFSFLLLFDIRLLRRKRVFDSTRPVSFLACSRALTYGVDKKSLSGFFDFFLPADYIIPSPLPSVTPGPISHPRVFNKWGANKSPSQWRFSAFPLYRLPFCDSHDPLPPMVYPLLFPPLPLSCPFLLWPDLIMCPVLGP